MMIPKKKKKNVFLLQRGKGQFKVLVTNTGGTSVEDRYSA